MPKLTIGMPTYSDFDGVYFSTSAIRLYHPEVIDDIELLVVDNHPDGPHAKATKKHVDKIGGVYVPFDKWTSTSVGKNLVFEHASAPNVVCIDDHILIAPGALARLLEYFEQNPGCKDLLQGPLLNNNFSVSTHFEDVWRGQMWGTWGTDERGKDLDAPPFEIKMQGCGLIACRKDAWLGFNDMFRGFGGQAGYIHAKYRKAGCKTLCLPFLRWMHRFDRPAGIKYRVSVVDKFRNYVIGFRELNLDTEPLLEHFSNDLRGDKMHEIITQVDEYLHPTPSVACLMVTHNRLPLESQLLNEAIYSFHQQTYNKKELIIINDCPGQIISYDHPDVIVVNISREFGTLGEKLNFAASLTKADLLCIWEDNNVSLPRRLSTAIEKLGSGRVWQSDSHWTIDVPGVLDYVDRSKVSTDSIFTHELFDEIGGLTGDDGYNDLQKRLLATAVGVKRELVVREECECIRRVGYRSSNRAAEECIFMPEPHFDQDYITMVKDARQVKR